MHLSLHIFSVQSGRREATPELAPQQMMHNHLRDQSEEEEELESEYESNPRLNSDEGERRVGQEGEGQGVLEEEVDSEAHHRFWLQKI